MSFILRGCETCGGDCRHDPIENEYVCIMCGRVRYKKEPNLLPKVSYYEESFYESELKTMPRRGVPHHKTKTFAT